MDLCPNHGTGLGTDCMEDQLLTILQVFSFHSSKFYPKEGQGAIQHRVSVTTRVAKIRLQSMSDCFMDSNSWF